MPKVISETEKRNRVLRGSIKNAQEIQGYSIVNLADLTGIPASTLYSRLKNPSDFRVWELRAIFKVLRIPTVERERIYKEVM